MSTLPRSQTEPSGPVRWRVTIAGCYPDLYSDRRRARAAVKLARLKGYVVTLTRVETVSRRWWAGSGQCVVRRCTPDGGWSWSVCRVGSVGAGWRETYERAVEAAEKAARGQR